MIKKDSKRTKEERRRKMKLVWNWISEKKGFVELQREIEEKKLKKPLLLRRRVDDSVEVER